MMMTLWQTRRPELVLLALTIVATRPSLAEKSNSGGVRWESPSLSRQPFLASTLPRQPLEVLSGTLQQAGQLVNRVRPIIPDGHRRFQFYMFGGDGQLVQRWMSLQQVQDLLLERGPYGGEGSGAVGGVALYSAGGELTPISERHPGLPTRPDDNIQGIIDTIQQVVSSEVIQNKQQPPTFPPNLTDHSGESIKIPDTILQNLLNVSHHLTTQWQFPTTTPPPYTQPVDTDTTASEQSAAITLATEVSSTTQEVIIGEEPTIRQPVGFRVTNKPLSNDRWNSRFPAWTEYSAEVDEKDPMTRDDLEPTDDYHSSPVGLTETIIPSVSELTPDAGLATWNYTSGASEGGQDTSGTSTLSNVQPDEVSSTETTTTTTIITRPQQVTTTLEEDNDLLTTKINPEDPLLYTLTDLYAQSYTNPKPSQPPSITTTTDLPVPETTTTQPHYETDTTTFSPFQSAFFDFVTNFFQEDSQSTFTTEPPTAAVTQTDYITSVPETSTYTSPTPDREQTATIKLPSRTTTLSSLPSGINKTDDLMTSTQSGYEESRPNHTSPPHEDDNLLPLNIRNPSSPQSPYDIVPIEDQTPTTTSTSAGQSTRPSNPYDGPIELLEVIQTLSHPGDSLLNESSASLPDTTTTLDQNGSPHPTTLLPSTQTPNILDQHLSIRDMMTQYYTTTKSDLMEESTTQETSSDPSTQSTTTPAPTTQYLTTLPSGDPRPQTAGEFPGETDFYYNSDSSVIPQSQLADKNNNNNDKNNNNRDRIDLESLQINGELTDGDNFYEYYGSPVYLDNLPEDYYNYDVYQPPGLNLNGTENLDFPGPNATSPYHDHHGEHHGDHHGGHHGDHHGGHHGDHHDGLHEHVGPPEDATTLLQAPDNNPGLEASVENLHKDVREFVDVMNDITFKVYKKAASQHKRRNFVMSPLSLISTLGMLLIGARGYTSGALSDLLQMDKFYTFNPHLILKNVTQSAQAMKNIHDVAFLNQFLVEKEKNTYSTDFFAQTIKVFYNAAIEDVVPANLDATVRRRVNELVRNSTNDNVKQFLLEEEPLFLTPPLTAVSTSFLHARWSVPVVQSELLDMHFIRFPTAERRLIRTVGLKKKMTINAGFSRAAGVTSAEIPLYSTSGEFSLVLAMPGEQKNFVANGLAQLEKTLTPAKWSQVLRSMLPNTVNLKMPVFRHRAFHNFSSVLDDLGLGQLFQEGKADFSGINHIKNLHLSDVVQLTEFQSCQVEEPPENGAITSQRRQSRSSLSGDDGNDMSVKEASMTYIYGFPMRDYLQLDKTKHLRMDTTGDGAFQRYFQKQDSSRDDDDSQQQASPTDSGSSQWTSSTGENSPQKSLSKVNASPPQQASSTDNDSSTQQASSTDNDSSTQQASSTDNASPPQQASSTDNDSSTQQASSTDNDSSTQQASSTNNDSSTQQASSTDHSPQETPTTTPHTRPTQQTRIENDGNSSPQPSSPSLDYPYDHYDNYGEDRNAYEEASPYLGSEDYRVDRMGVTDTADNDSTPSRPSDGAYYRQNKIGTLAFDRAFLYAVRHNPTGLLLFLGRYLDPEGN
ncbi:uncharacterized protein LOC121859049 [Homarus americanus]|uniref:uncharacterized protein LOC121859049 n=1 Tax=Homarus americanus TaxID=6706 RepID=UPI001C484B2F|nr:uncharacterized protein LOC121859049 [Homarus americanus]